MSGSSAKKTGMFFQSKRAYLFGLLAIVTFLGLNLLFPNQNVQKRTSVSVEFQHDGSDLAKEAVQQALLNELKTQLTAETLTKTIEVLQQKTTLVSQLFSVDENSKVDIESIRKRLMGGALSVESIPANSASNDSSQSTSGSNDEADQHIHHDEQNQDGKSDESTAHHSGVGHKNVPLVSAFRISLDGKGTADELLFVKLLVQQIKSSISPDYDRSEIKREIENIHDGILATSKLNQNLRRSINDTFDQFTRRQNKLLASAAQSTTGITASSSENWELKQLRSQREQLVSEFQRNNSQDFAGKENVQNQLQMRIDYLNQEINKLSVQDNSHLERVAEQKNSVERATFVESGTTAIQPFELERELSGLKTEVALLVGKTEIVEKQHFDNLKLSSKLSGIIDGGAESTISIGSPKQAPISNNLKGFLWFAMISAVISGIAVSRIHSGAFGNHYVDSQSVEQTLQLPVIDSITLPNGSGAGDSKIVAQQTQLVRILIKTCEVVLVVGLVGAVVLLLLHSEPVKQSLIQSTSFFQ